MIGCAYAEHGVNRHVAQLVVVAAAAAGRLGTTLVVHAPFTKHTVFENVRKVWCKLFTLRNSLYLRTERRLVWRADKFCFSTFFERVLIWNRFSRQNIPFHSSGLPPTATSNTAVIHLVSAIADATSIRFVNKHTLMRFWRGHNRVAPGVPAALMGLLAITTALFMTAIVSVNCAGPDEQDTSGG